MIQAQIQIGDPHEGHLASPVFFLGNNSRFKRARDEGVVSLSRHDTSTDMLHNLLGSPRDLDPRSNVDLTFKGHHTYVPTRLCKRNAMASES